MHPTGSFCYTVLERVRAYLDEPDANAKYDNNFVIAHLVCPAMVDVLARLNMNRDNVVRHFLPLSLVAETEFYQLPPSVLEVESVGVYDSGGNCAMDALPRSMYHPGGQGWSLEGNRLRIRPIPSSALDLTIVYIHNGDCLPHYGSGTLALVDDVHRVTLAGTPTVGYLDRRENAYSGQILRLLPSAPGMIEERVISGSFKSGSSWYAEVDTPFSASAGAVTYEIAPIGAQALYEAIAVGAAMKLGVYRKVPQATMEELRLQWRSAMKTIGDNYANMQARIGKAFDRNVRDNEGVRSNILFRSRIY